MTRPDLTRLDTRGYGTKTFFATDVQPAVLEACRRQGIRFDDLAIKLGTTRAALVLILKGHDPVPRAMLDRLRGLVEGESSLSSAA